MTILHPLLLLCALLLSSLTEGREFDATNSPHSASKAASLKAQQTKTASSGPTVAVIGSGPGGMSFVHALETMRHKLLEEGDEATLASLPIVTCFERAPGPGGVWRSERTFRAAADMKGKDTDTCYTYDEASTNTTTNMYEALWTNGPKETVEYYDHTFQEHFKHPLPVFMPRQLILEYMLARFTKNCPHFFDKYMKFNTSVQSVRYIETTSKFEVITRDMHTGEEHIQEFDKCIWAGGENGRPKMPRKLLEMFDKGGFRGKMIHSSYTANFEADVKGKRVLLIGGSYSAEDLALMAVKCGVERVYVSSRQDHASVVSWTKAWPGNKVEILEAQTPVAVTENGNRIQFAKTRWQWPNSYIPDDSVETVLCDINTIIFCAGYFPNFDMLDPDLRQAVKKDPNLTLAVPSDWKMEPNNVTDLVGDVEPRDVRWMNSAIGYPGLYRGLSIRNPNMMFLVSSADNPLFGIDVNAWLLLRFIVGLNKIPSAEEMYQQNQADAIHQMDNVYLRYCMDYAYYKAYNATHHDKPEHQDKLWGFYYESKSNHNEYYYRLLARSIQESEYPASYGSYDNLNERVQTLREYGMLSYYARYNLSPDDNDSDWKTFRDIVEWEKIHSTFTGQQAVPLKKRWIEIDVNDAAVLKP